MPEPSEAVTTVQHAFADSVLFKEQESSGQKPNEHVLRVICAAARDVTHDTAFSWLRSGALLSLTRALLLLQGLCI